MTSDDLHAKLDRALDLAADAPDGSYATANTKEILESLVQPLAIALCALELRAIRQSFEGEDELVEAMPEERAAALYITTKRSDAEDIRERDGELPLDAPGPNEVLWARSVLRRPEA